MYCPLVFFRILVLGGQFGIYYLIVSLGNNIFDLLFSQSLEVIWYESMWGKLRFSSCEILLHDITHIGSFNFRSILSLLICSPVRFSLFLLSSKILVIGLHVLEHLILTCIILIFHHTSHCSDSRSLFSILFCLKCIVLILPLVLSGLLLNPLFLQLCIWGDTVAVACNYDKKYIK